MGLEASQLKRIKELEEENSKLKRMYADVSLQQDALKDLIKKALAPDEKRVAVGFLQKRGVSLRQACMLLRLSSSVYYYKSQARAEDFLIEEMLTGLAERHRRWGFWKMYRFIRGQSAYTWNNKRVYRVYTSLGLSLRRKCKRRLPPRE